MEPTLVETIPGFSRNKIVQSNILTFYLKMHQISIERDIDGDFLLMPVGMEEAKPVKGPDLTQWLSADNQAKRFPSKIKIKVIVN